MVLVEAKIKNERCLFGSFTVETCPKFRVDFQTDEMMRVPRNDNDFFFFSSPSIGTAIMHRRYKTGNETMVDYSLNVLSDYQESGVLLIGQHFICLSFAYGSSIFYGAYNYTSD